jgi:hypothetical protein
MPPGLRRAPGPWGGALFAAFLLAGCSPSPEETDFLARKAILQRQNQGIRELIAEAGRGPLVPADRFIVGVDEQVVEGLLRSQLPFERPLGKRFVIRLESATVRLRDKFGLVTIEGNVHRPADSQHRTAVRIHGGLGEVRLDPETDLLSMRIAIDRVELLEAGVLENVLGPGGKKFVSEKGRDVLKDALPVLQVPVALAQNVRVPAIVEGPVRLDSLRIPLNLSVERVLAAAGKLWLTLNADVGHVTGAESGLGIAVKLKPGKPRSPAPDARQHNGGDSARGGS